MGTLGDRTDLLVTQMRKGLISEWIEINQHLVSALVTAPTEDVLQETLERMFKEYPNKDYQTRLATRGVLWEVESEVARQAPEFSNWPTALVHRQKERE